MNKRDREALMKMPGFDASQPWHATTAALAPIVDEAYRALKAGEPRREYLGASMLGQECARAVAYAYHGAERDADREPAGRVYRIFDAGHVLEDRMADYLRSAGFDLRTHDKDGKQYDYSVAGGRIQGHIDGVFVGGPAVDGLTYPALWENKALNDKAWSHVVEHGLKASKPVYFNQVQILMAYMELDLCLFTAINKNTSAIHYECVALDTSVAQWLSDRAVNIIQSRNADEFPRIGRDATDWRCKFCDFHDLCWGIGKPQEPTPAPNWLRPTTQGE